MLHYIRTFSLDLAAMSAILFVILYYLGLGKFLLPICIALILLLAVFLALSFVKIHTRLRAFRRTVILCVLSALLALFCCYRVEYKNNIVAKYENSEQIVTITAYAVEEGNAQLFGKSTVRVTKINDKECDITLSLYRTNVPSPKPYVLFEGSVVFNLPDDKEYVAADKNIAACAELVSIDKTLQDIRTPTAYLWRVGNSISKKLYTHLDTDAAALADALLLGNRKSLPDRLTRDFKTLGVTHLLAISGLHLSVLTAGILFIFRKLRTPLVLRNVITALLILLYMGLCGFTPSILRAGLMALCLLFYHTFGETQNGLRALLYSNATILLLQPYLCQSISLQLSVFATLGILLIFPYLFPKEKKKSSPIRILGRFVLAQFYIFLAATLLTLPVTFYWFGSFSLLAPIGNLVLVPIITLLMYLLPLFLLTLLCAPLATLLASGIGLLSKLVYTLASLARYGKDLYCSIPAILPVLLLIVIPILLILYRYHFKYKRLLPIALCMVLLASVYPYSLYKDERLFYRYDTHRETILYEKGNEVLLIETGNASLQNAYTALVETQYTLGQTGIDGLLLTHYHNATLNFVRYLTSNTYLDTIYLPSPQSQSEAVLANEIRLICKDTSVACVEYGFDTAVSHHDLELTMHNEILERSEHPALAIALKSGSHRILLADPAVFELDGLGATSLGGVDSLIFLSSAPVDKYPLPDFPQKDGVFALYGSKEQFLLIGGGFSQYKVLSSQKPNIFLYFQTA